MSVPIPFLSNLSETWKETIVIVGILTAGITIGIAITGWYGLPARFRALEAIQKSADSSQRDLTQQIAAIRQLIRQQLCLSVSDRRHTPWEDCVLPTGVTKP